MIGKFISLSPVFLRRGTWADDKCDGRSLCTLLGAAEAFKPSHLETEDVKSLIAGAKYFYLGGFFLTHGVESAKILATHAVENRKVRSHSSLVYYASTSAVPAVRTFANTGYTFVNRSSR